MPRALVYLSHADPSVAPKYLEAFAEADLAVDLVLVNNFVPGKLSNAYVELADRLTRGERILPTLRAKYPPPHLWAEYDVRIACSFSAGYALWRRVFAIVADASEFTGYVGIDSWHASLEGDHTADDRQLAPLVALALAAKEGPRVLWYGHTDVATPQTGPSAYASTTQVAAELERIASGTGGGFHVDAFDLDRDQTKEHGHALTVWGPGYLARAIAEAFERRGVEHLEPLPGRPSPPDEDLGVAALRWSRAELEADHGESPPGSNAGPDVARYLAGCERNGKPLGIKSGEWCAAGASCAAFTSRRPGQDVPHRWRASVLELWRDACELGTARSAELVRAGGYSPKVGDLVVLTRGTVAAGSTGNEFGPSDGKGHVGRFATHVAGDGSYTSLDANHGSTWGEALRSIHAPELVGVIAYDAAPRPISDMEVAQLTRLSKLSTDVWLQNGIGIDAIDAVMQLDG